MKGKVDVKAWERAVLALLLGGVFVAALSLPGTTGKAVLVLS